jgi:hypothetical protein
MDLRDGTPFWPRRDGLLSVHPPYMVEQPMTGITFSAIAAQFLAGQIQAARLTFA